MCRTISYGQKGAADFSFTKESKREREVIGNKKTIEYWYLAQRVN